MRIITTTSTNGPFINMIDDVPSVSRKAHEEELRRRQEEHLRNVEGNRDAFWQPCMHDNCGQCHGTGIKLDGSMCVHMISCPCPKCSPR